jgi:diaminopimelate epimerase
MKFIINERLQWRSLVPSGPPFSNPDDLKVLYNDWPYGVDSRIVHLVVWVKFDLKDDPDTGFLTSEATRQIQDYVNSTFCSRMEPDHVMLILRYMRMPLQLTWLDHLV